KRIQTNVLLDRKLETTHHFLHTLERLYGDNDLFHNLFNRVFLPYSNDSTNQGCLIPHQFHSFVYDIATMIGSACLVSAGTQSSADCRYHHRNNNSAIFYLFHFVIVANYAFWKTYPLAYVHHICPSQKNWPQVTSMLMNTPTWIICQVREAIAFSLGCQQFQLDHETTFEFILFWLHQIKSQNKNKSIPLIIHEWSSSNIFAEFSHLHILMASPPQTISLNARSTSSKSWKLGCSTRKDLKSAKKIVFHKY
ncbi:hypothetical protein RFI_18715, partial [Reticulomyxa filosa]